MSCWIPGTGGLCTDIEYRATITAPGTKPLTVRWITSTLAVNATSVVVTDPPSPEGRVCEFWSMDNAVTFTASGALSRQLRIVLNGTAAQIDPVAAITMAAMRQNALIDLRNMRSPFHSFSYSLRVFKEAYQA